MEAAKNIIMMETMTGPTIVARRLITNNRYIFILLGSTEGDVFGHVISVPHYIHFTKLKLVYSK